VLENLLVASAGLLRSVGSLGGTTTLVEVTVMEFVVSVLELTVILLVVLLLLRVAVVMAVVTGFGAAMLE